MHPSELDELASAFQEPPVRGVRLHRLQPVHSLKGHAGACTNHTPGRQGHWPLASEASPPADGLAVAAERLPLPPELAAALGPPVPWAEDGYYLPLTSPLGHSVHHETGAFYIQEPSAMAPVAALDPVPGEAVLDLCAAPGGKATAIGARLRGRGVLVANDVHPQRAEILAQNLERTGVPAIVTQAAPDVLADAWPACFDAVLVDAPCSGEGMFRKDETACAAWHEEAPSLCAMRQRDILVAALRLLRPGGRLVYSTCTFNPVENEQVVAWLRAHFPVALDPLPAWPGWEPGRPEWADGHPDLVHTRRLWPHRGRGEGHFVARMHLLDTVPGDVSGQSQGGKRSVRPRSHHGHAIKPGPAVWSRRPAGAAGPFASRAAGALLAGLLADLLAHPERSLAPLDLADAAWIRQGNVWFACPPDGVRLLVAPLRALRPGLAVASEQGRRLVPHHALAMAIAHGAAAHPLALDPQQAAAFLAGEALPAADGEAGWRWLHLGGLPLGWGRASDGRINNLYPKGLRRRGLVTPPYTGCSQERRS
ncbi:23S rRNA methyltransferase [Alicyclobacillus cellulosilyticus]|uniref:23S rRNA methyltransferase n=2 Tax=Alicyclobacillus cellulosilyticus TaxID=1003997 RepID=A0A917NJW7_9BACL|nr:23S rRNA methyltransferase [Alicyclobacillus cellulosilyticus]